MAFAKTMRVIVDMTVTEVVVVIIANDSNTDK